MELNTRSYVVNRSARMTDIKKILKTHSQTESIPSKTFPVYFIDTPDWHLAAAGFYLQCEFNEPTYVLSLRKSSNGDVLHETVDVLLPQHASDLLPGKLGRLVQDITGDAPLITHLSLKFVRNRTNLLDDNGKIISKIEFNQASFAPTDSDRSTGETLRYLELLPVMGFQHEFQTLTKLVEAVPNIEPATNPHLLRTLVKRGRLQQATIEEAAVTRNYAQDNWNTIRKILGDQLDTMQRNIPLVIKHGSFGQIREFRDAVQRSRSVLANFHDLVPTGLREKISSFLAEINRFLAPLCNMDELLDNVEEYTSDLPGGENHQAEAFIDQLHERRHALQQDLIKFLESPFFLNIFWDWKRVLSTADAISELSADISVPLEAHFHDNICSVFQKLLERIAGLDYDASLEQINDLSRANTKLQYLMEFYARYVVCKKMRQSIKVVNKFQLTLDSYLSRQGHTQTIRKLRDDLDRDNILSPETVATVDTILETVSKKLISTRMAFLRQQNRYFDKRYQQRINRIFCR